MSGTRKLNIDWTEVDKMLVAGCDGTEVAASIGVAPDTLYLRCKQEHGMVFSAYLQQKRASGDRLIRQKQFQVAMEGDKTMLVWLGKQRLGQTDRTDPIIADVTIKLTDATPEDRKDH